MRLSTNSYVVLGLLRSGARSGYEIKRAADAAIRQFWVLSPPQVYSELNSLEEAGLIAGRSSPRGERPRRLFELTPAGADALEGWLTDGRPSEIQVRDAAMLKLYFADAMQRDDVVEHVRSMRVRAERTLEHFRRTIIPLAHESAEHGLEYPMLTASFGAEMCEWVCGWAADTERRLSGVPAPTDAGQADEDGMPLSKFASRQPAHDEHAGGVGDTSGAG